MLTKAWSIHRVMFSTRIIAVLMGFLCHSTFLGACTVMCLALFGTLNAGPVSLHGWPAYAINILLLVQFLTITMIQAGLPIQMGYLGWWSVFRGRRPHYSEFPHHGLYRTCRHPVYLAMALVTITGPVWTLDHLLV